MAVASEHKVDAPCAADDLLITHTFLFPPKMRDADDEVAVLFLQEIRRLLRRLHRVEIFRGAVVLVVNQAVKPRRQSEDTDLQAIALDDDIRLHDLVESILMETIVGTDDGKVESLKHPRHVLQTEVELVVADSPGIIVHHVHQPALYIALEQGIVRRALAEIATVEEQQTGIFPSLFLEHGDAAEEPAAACLQRVGKMNRERHDTAMRVVGMKNGQMLLSRNAQRREKQCQHKQDNLYIFDFHLNLFFNYHNYQGSTVTRPSTFVSAAFPCALRCLK